MNQIDHWQAFADFCRLDKLTGGPDSHMKTIVEMYRNSEDPAWACGVYAAVYNVPMAQAILNLFPNHIDILDLEQWLNDCWKSVVLRRERKRPVGSPTKLWENLDSYARWISADEIAALSKAHYDYWWKSIDEVKYFGRYSKLKCLEALRQMGIIQEEIDGLRPEGGWSPREGLALLYPAEKELLEDGGNRPNVVASIEVIAQDALTRLNGVFGVWLSRYEFQTLICDYKQVAVTERQYPGRSVDSELTYYEKVAANFALDGRMFEARKKLFPHWALGELNGWPGVREELGEFFIKTGKMWSDQIYDYNLSRKDIYNPVVKK